MAATLAMLKLCIEEWLTSFFINDIVRFVSLLFGAYITFKVVTLKYNWLRKLAGLNK